MTVRHPDKEAALHFSPDEEEILPLARILSRSVTTAKIEMQKAAEVKSTIY